MVIIVITIVLAIICIVFVYDFQAVVISLIMKIVMMIMIMKILKNIMMLTSSPPSPTLSLPSLRAKSCPADIKRSPCRQFSFLFFLFLGGTLMPITLPGVNWFQSLRSDLEDDNDMWWFVGGRGRGPNAFKYQNPNETEDLLPEADEWTQAQNLTVQAHTGGERYI